MVKEKPSILCLSSAYRGSAITEFHETRHFLAEMTNCTFYANIVFSTVCAVLCSRDFFSLISGYLSFKNMDVFRRFFTMSVRMPVVKADEEELVDPQTVLREECGEKHCSTLQEIYDKCNKRVQSKKNTAETCVEELFDFMGCVDHCVAETLFTKLK